jgi:hypothetical protein
MAVGGGGGWEVVVMGVEGGTEIDFAHALPPFWEEGGRRGVGRGGLGGDCDDDGGGGGGGGNGDVDNETNGLSQLGSKRELGGCNRRTLKFRSEKPAYKTTEQLSN